MNQELVDNLFKAMEKPHCKMLSAAMMAALIHSGFEQQEMTKRIENISQELLSLAEKIPTPFDSILMTNGVVWALPEESRLHFFSEDDLTYSGLMEIVSAGADDWASVADQGGVTRSDLSNYYELFTSLISKLFTENELEKPETIEILSLYYSIAQSYAD